MKTKKIVLGVLLFALVVGQSGCSYFRARQTEIQQGNVVTQAMVDQLHPGMTTEQVTYIMGTPLLKSTLDRTLWTYVYTFQRGGKGKMRKQHLNIHFKKGRLSSISGRYLPV